MYYENKATVTPREATEMFQAAGIPIAVTTLQDGLKQNKFPFGIAIECKNWVFLIYKKDLEEYLAAHTYSERRENA